MAAGLVLGFSAAVAMAMEAIAMLLVFTYNGDGTWLPADVLRRLS